MQKLRDEVPNPIEESEGGKMNLDHLREKLAELTTIYNAIPPACPEALALVQARIDSVKKEMQGNAAN